MTYHRTLLAAPLVGALLLIGVIVAQTNKSRPLTIKLPPPPQVINVDASSACVDIDQKPAASTDTVEWHIDSSATSVSDFHIIFTKKSPAMSKRRYFDKNNYKTGPLVKPANNAESFEYVISVDGGCTCDPHVIVIGGRDDDKN